jgi:hypothetical protein
MVILFPLLLNMCDKCCASFSLSLSLQQQGNKDTSQLRTFSWTGWSDKHSDNDWFSHVQCFSDLVMMVATVVGVLFSGSLDVKHLILLVQVSLLKWYTFAPRNVKLGALPLDGRHLILLEVFAEMVHFSVQECGFRDQTVTMVVVMGQFQLVYLSYPCCVLVLRNRARTSDLNVKRSQCCCMLSPWLDDNCHFTVSVIEPATCYQYNVSTGLELYGQFISSKL